MDEKARSEWAQLFRLLSVLPAGDAQRDDESGREGQNAQKSHGGGEMVDGGGFQAGAGGKAADRSYAAALDSLRRRGVL